MFKRKKDSNLADIQGMSDAVKSAYESRFLYGYSITSASTDGYMASTGIPMDMHIPYHSPMVYNYEEEEVDYIYCDNCHCIIPDEQLKKVGNCNHCGAPPPKGLKHAR